MSKVENRLFVAIAVIAVVAVGSFIVFAGGLLVSPPVDDLPPQVVDPGPKEAPKDGSSGSFSSGSLPKERRPDPRPELERPPKVVRPNRAAEEGGATVVGRVIDSQRRPIDGATALIFKENRRRWQETLDSTEIEKSGEVFQAKSNVQGKFIVSGILPGARYVLLVKHPSYAARRYESKLTLMDGKETEVPSIVLGKGASISGFVQESGGGFLEGARVVLASGHYYGIDIHADHEFLTKSDEEGRFTFLNVPSGRRRLYGWVEGFSMGGSEPFDVAEGADHTDFLVELTRGQSIHGFVRSTDGKPVPGAKIYATPAKSGVMARGAGESGEDGAFEIGGLTEDSFWVTAVADGWSRSKKTMVTPGGDSVVLEMQANSKVTGVVLDRFSREPVKDFSVATKKANSAPLVGISKFKRFTNEEGAFELTDVEPNTYYLIVKATGFAAGKSTEFVVMRGGDGAPVTVELDKGSTVSGTVLQVGGQPVGNAEVILEPSKTANNFAFDAIGLRRRDLKRAQTPPDGTYGLLNISPGTYRVKVTHRNYAEFLSAEFTVPDGGQNVDVEPAYLAGGGGVQGTVKKADGTADRRARVSITRVGFNKYAQTDREGKYRFDHIPAGEYKLSVVARSGKADLGGLFDLQARDVIVVEGQVETVDL